MTTSAKLVAGARNREYRQLYRRSVGFHSAIWFRLSSDAVESGNALAPLVKKLHERQAKREALLAAIAAAEGADKAMPNRQAIERKVQATIKAWRKKLTTDGRQVLREVLDGPIRFTPTGRRYQFDADLTTGSLIEGLVGTPTFLASPTGFEPVF